MTSAKKDPLLFEENLSCDLKRYQRAVAAMQYYGARVNSGIASGDNRMLYKSPEMRQRMPGLLPATFPVACKFVPGDSTCYYHMIPDGHMELPQYETHLTSDAAPDCIPSTSSTGEQRVNVLTKKSLSLPINQTVCMVDKVKCILSSSSPTRTKIPVAQANRSNIKLMNGAYFAPCPPAKPMPIKVYPPSMIGRKDITHSCIHHQKQEVDMSTIKMCERVIAEAVNSGKNPNEINISPAVLKHIPPRKLVESMKERTFTMQRRRAEQLSSPEHSKASMKAALNVQEQSHEQHDINYTEAESNCKEESDNTDDSEYPEEQISLIETPSNLIEMSNDSSSEVGCVNTLEKTSEVTIQGDLHSHRSDETIKDSLSNQDLKPDHDPATKLLAESLLADIVLKFPSHEKLCADLKINKQCAKFPNKPEPSNDILNNLNNVLQHHANKDIAPSADSADVLSTDTEESCSTDFKNESTCAEKEEEEELAAQVKEIAQRMVQLEPVNKKSSMWCGSPKNRSGYAHSTSTGLGFITHNVPTSETSTSSSSSEISTTERKFIQRTVSTYTSRICCNCEKEIKNLHPTFSHKSIQVSISTRPTSKRVSPHKLNKHSHLKEHCTPPSCNSQEFGDHGQGKPVKRCKSSRLMADLKKSQQILSLVDAVLQNEDETMSSDCMGDTVRLKSSRTMAKIHKSRITTGSPSRLMSRECVQYMQVLRNEHVQHMQHQLQNIISLNDFIDKFQSLH